MSDFKEKAKEKYETAKEYVKEHTEEIIVSIYGGVHRHINAYRMQHWT